MIDWTKPIEAYHEDGTVAPATVLDAANGKVHCDAMPMDGNWWFDTSGKAQVYGWRIRNVAEPKDGVPEWAVKRALAEVNDFPTGPCGGEKWTMDEIIDRRRGVFRYQAAVITLARYIAAHEQPPVDPDLIEAEDIVERMAQDGCHISATNEGLCVEAALRAIKRGRELERGEGK